MSEEFYPMPSFPTLIVKDLVTSTHWYQETLGFRLVFEMPSASGQPVLTHLRWTKYADLLLVAENPHQLLSEPKGNGVTLTFAVSSGSLDALADTGTGSRCQHRDRPSRAALECAGSHNARS